jgi:hypothetical protein
VRSTAAPYTESRLTRSVANERVGFPVVEHLRIPTLWHKKLYIFGFPFLKFIHKTVVVDPDPKPFGQLDPDPDPKGQ